MLQPNSKQFDYVFAGVDELVDWAIARRRENGYVLVRRRSKTNATGVVIKVWLKCDRGGVYHGEPKARHTGSKKTGCEFELIGRYERSCGGWKLRVVNNEHNHLAAEQLGGHPYAMRLNENETQKSPATNNTLDNIVGHVIQIVKSQAEAINESFERSKIFRMAHHNDDQFELLKGNVSHVALDLLVGEKAKIQMLIASNSSCGCHLFTSCGLPCACRLLNNAKVTLDEVDLFWRKLDLNPSLVNEDEGADIDAQLDRVIQHIKLQPNPVKKKSLKWSKPEFAPRRYWMQMPETGLLIANAFGVIVVFISLGASVTIFPLWTSPEFLQPHRIVSFVFINDNHFVMVELTEDYPMPTPSWYWSRFKSQDAAAWEMWYKQRLDLYTNWLESHRKPPGFVDLDKQPLTTRISYHTTRKAGFRNPLDDRCLPHSDTLSPRLPHSDLDPPQLETGMMRWMTERMTASAGMDIPVFPGPGHHQDPQDPGGHA
ncbi:hypothetical protein E3N88_41280 [Mikania micrantha]|uniref:Protein FAR1-RELATED SEQUENCE n=1 Tax=Mikania micrantha TaxID=192012 RepID=A0A5N6LPY3_9ASTR|nr:hypothetical protein E3N88_41280 [Mikania micrantha]